MMNIFAPKRSASEGTIPSWITKMQRQFCIAFLCGLLALVVPSCSLQKTVTQAQIEESVVRIINVAGDSMGTGFIVNSEEGYIVTNSHVVEGATNLVVHMKKGNGYKELNARVVEKSEIQRVIREVNQDNQVVYDEEYVKDLAILKVDSGKLNRALAMASEPAEKGSPVIALGFMFTQELTVGELDATVTRGTIYKYHLEDGVTWIEHNAEIAQGNSGGPLVSESGEVVGVNTKGIDALGHRALFSIAASEVNSILDARGVIYTKRIPNGEAVSLAFPAVLVFAGLVISLSVFLQYRKRVKDDTGHQSAGAGVATPPPTQGGGLEGQVGPHQNQQFDIGSGVRIGRDPRICNLPVPLHMSNVSKSHVEVRYNADRSNFTLTDTWSTTGTFLGSGQRLKPGVETTVSAGMTFYLGDRSVEYSLFL